MNGTTQGLPPDPSPGRERAWEAAFTVAIVAIVLLWPGIIPVVLVTLSALALQR